MDDQLVDQTLSEKVGDIFHQSLPSCKPFTRRQIPDLTVSMFLRSHFQMARMAQMSMVFGRYVKLLWRTVNRRLHFKCTFCLNYPTRLC